MDIFVGNLSFDSTESDVKTLFEKFGGVSSVVIMMREGKKNAKSRGFGFVQMPDEVQAQAAIEALNTTEFMGRALTVEMARPKKEKPFSTDTWAEERDESRSQNEERPWQRREPVKPWVSRPGKYKGGRRTRSYVSRHGSTDMDKPASPWQRNKNNPMRWRKDKDQPKPWHKPAGESKPWRKSEEGSKPWEKPAGESKPWRRAEGASKPWHKTTGESKPWRKAEGGPKPWHKPGGKSKPWRKTEGASRPWHKSEEGSKPWEKPAGESKPWRKTEGGRKPWRKSGSEVKPWEKRSGGRFKSWGKGDKRKPKAGFNSRKEK